MHDSRGTHYLNLRKGGMCIKKTEKSVFLVYVFDEINY